MVFEDPESKKVSEIKRYPFTEESSEEIEERMDELLDEFAKLIEEAKELLNKISKSE